MNAAARLRILDGLAKSIAERGYDGLDLAALAEGAGLRTEEVAAEFLRKDLAVLALYERFATTFRETLELPEGTVAERFRAAMLGKLAVLAPHRRALAAVVRHAIDPEDRLAVQGPESLRVRRQVAAIFASVVAGASDAPADPQKRRALGHLLYGAHLLVVLTWMLDEGAVPELLEVISPGLTLLPMIGTLDGAQRFAERLLPLALEDGAGDRARALLDRLLLRHRLRAGIDADAARAAVHEVWADRIAARVAASLPLHLVLPGFPAKSPNPQKVLGPLPDRAERLALASLEQLAAELEELHPPGVRLTIASDGHVFGPVVGVSDADCDAYRDAVRGLLADARHLDWFDLSDALGEGTADELRERMLATYGEPLEALRARGATPLVDGIHRFLTEDELGCHPGLSKTQARARTWDRAWETVRRSQAWGALVGAAFPDAVRLSIHPQPLGSEKIGVHLLPVDDAWLTPWHGAALLDRDGYRLVKRGEVPDATVVLDDDGRPDHLARP